MWGHRQMVTDHRRRLLVRQPHISEDDTIMTLVSLARPPCTWEFRLGKVSVYRPREDTLCASPVMIWPVPGPETARLQSKWNGDRAEDEYSHSSNVQMSSPSSQTPFVELRFFGPRGKRFLIYFSYAIYKVNFQVCKGSGQRHWVAMVGPWSQIDDEDLLKLYGHQHFTWWHEPVTAA